MTRRLDRPAASLERTLRDWAYLRAETIRPLDDRGRLRFGGPFTPNDMRPVTWQATARLLGRGPRLVAFARVRVEVSVWSERASLLSLTPRSARFAHWGAHRRRRYFELAHLGADRMARLLLDAAPDPRLMAHATSGEPSLFAPPFASVRSAQPW